MTGLDTLPPPPLSESCIVVLETKRLVLRAPQLVVEPLEPLSALVGDQPLQGHQVHQLPGIVGSLQLLVRPRDDVPRGLDVAAEVGEVTARQQDRTVGGVVLQRQSRQGRARGREVVGERRRPRQPGADQPVLGACGERYGLAVGRHGLGVAQRHEQVAPPREQVVL